MKFPLVLSLTIALLATVFALQNLQPADVRIGPYLFTGPLALVLLLTLAMGVLVGYLANVPRRLRARKRIHQLEAEAKKPTPGGVMGGEPSPANLDRPIGGDG